MLQFIRDCPINKGAGERVRGWLNGIDISWVISHG